MVRPKNGRPKSRGIPGRQVGVAPAHTVQAVAHPRVSEADDVRKVDRAHCLSRQMDGGCKEEKARVHLARGQGHQAPRVGSKAPGRGPKFIRGGFSPSEYPECGIVSRKLRPPTTSESEVLRRACRNCSGTMRPENEGVHFVLEARIPYAMTSPCRCTATQSAVPGRETPRARIGRSTTYAQSARTHGHRKMPANSTARHRFMGPGEVTSSTTRYIVGTCSSTLLGSNL